MWYLQHHLRRFFRSWMKPMDQDRAAKWLLRMRIMYVLSGATAFAFSYKIYYENKEKYDEINSLDPTYSHKILRLKDVRGDVGVLRIGWGKTEYFEFNGEEYIKEYEEKAKKLKEKMAEAEKQSKPKSEFASEDKPLSSEESF